MSHIIIILYRPHSCNELLCTCHVSILTNNCYATESRLDCTGLTNKVLSNNLSDFGSFYVRKKHILGRIHAQFLLCDVFLAFGPISHIPKRPFPKCQLPKINGNVAKCRVPKMTKCLWIPKDVQSPCIPTCETHNRVFTLLREAAQNISMKSNRTQS